MFNDNFRLNDNFSWWFWNMIGRCPECHQPLTPLISMEPGQLRGCLNNKCELFDSWLMFEMSIGPCPDSPERLELFSSERRGCSVVVKEKGAEPDVKSLYHLIGDGELSARCFIAATTRQQARQCFTEDPPAGSVE